MNLTPVLLCALALPLAAKSDAPIHAENSASAIPGRYIVVFTPGTPGAAVNAAMENANVQGGRVDYVYETAVQGFAGRLPPQAIFGLSHNPNVAFIEADQVAKASLVTQTPATWGLDRVDRHYLPMNGSYTYNFTGANVTAYIVDTGIRITHSDFGGRAVWGYDFVDGDAVAYDCNGHGTHVAGTVGGATYGIAKDVRLVAVRVLDCDGSGTMSGVIAGVDWVTANHTTGKAVANMSLGGGVSLALDNAVGAAVADGVVFAVAAGNDNANACQTSPARAPEAITVGATNSSDARAQYSNKGTCLDLFAPGTGITSAWISNDAATLTISGTSMASPHVAGVAALYLEAHSATPKEVRDAIVNAATPGVVKKRGLGSPDRLLYSLIP